MNHLMGGERRRTEGTNLARPLQIGERSEGLLDVGVGIGAMNLVKVDPVGVQAAQAVLDFADDPAPGVSALVGITLGARRSPEWDTHLDVDLRGEHHIVALAARERLADDDLRFTL
jgi:hypothetical protein